MYYPEQRFVSEMAHIQREAILPDEAVGNVLVKEGQLVDMRDHVARGLIQQEHIIIDALPQLHLRHADMLPDLMLVETGSRVAEGDAIAGKDPERGRRVFAPTDGMVAYVGEGRIIIQTMPQVINLEAGVRGRVAKVYPERGVAIQSTGAVVQGIWGNGRNLVSTLRIEPEAGLDSLSRDSLETAYRNEIVITNTPLTLAKLEVAQARNIGGLVAPSMDASLLNVVLNAHYAILLTDGFGEHRMSNAVYSLLQEFESQQATLDAYMPQRWESRRPEIVINRPPDEESGEHRKDVALKIGLRVRVTRQPYMGVTGQIVDLPNIPILLDNGLRVKCALIERMPDDIIDVPIANLELAGR